MRKHRIPSRVFTLLVYVFLYAPIILLIVFSFNATKSNRVWGGFSLQWYEELFQNARLLGALRTTLILSVLAAVIATILGTAAAIGFYSMRRRAHGQGAAGAAEKGRRAPQCGTGQDPGYGSADQGASGGTHRGSLPGCHRPGAPAFGASSLGDGQCDPDAPCVRSLRAAGDPGEDPGHLHREPGMLSGETASQKCDRPEDGIPDLTGSGRSIGLAKAGKLWYDSCRLTAAESLSAGAGTIQRKKRGRRYGK